MSAVLGFKADEVYTSEVFDLGTIHRNHDGKVYKFVKYDTGAGAVAAVAAQVAYYYLASGYNAHIVTSDLSDSVNLGAGVLLSAPTDGQYCWIQIRGPATLALALTAGADGNALTAVGATDGTLDVSAAVTDAVVAFADDISEKEIICFFPE
jgi:hypothetical protein